MADIYRAQNTIVAPARRSATITPSDANTFDPTRSLVVVSGGTVVLRLADDDHDETWPNLPAYAVLPLQVIAVRAAGTNASHIKALW